MKKFITISALSLFILTACSTPLPISSNTPNSDDSQPADTSSTELSTQPDQLFTIEIGEKVQFQPAGLAIEFVGVKSDSRCPSDVVCVWAGEATVQIKSTTQGPDVDAELIIPGVKDTIELKGDVGSPYNLKFIDLKPYPNSKTPASDSQYQATFIFQTIK